MAQVPIVYMYYHAAFMKLSSQLDSMVPKPNLACKECGVTDKYEQQNEIFHFMMGLSMFYHRQPVTGYPGR